MSPIQQTMFEEAVPGQLTASFQSHFEESKDALLLLSNHGAVLNANKNFQALCRYDHRELCETALTTLFPVLDKDGLTLPLHLELSGRPLLTITTRMRLKTGAPQPVELFICPVPVGSRHPEKEIYQALIKKTVLPQPENKPSQARLNAERLKSIGALAGGIAHNFNNIMTGLYGNITLAKMESRQTPKALAHLQKAESSMEEVARLTRQLLTFAKGGSPLKESFNPEPLIRDIAGLNLAGSAIRLEVKAPRDLWLLHADKKQLEQVVANIVVNARQAMGRKGVLSVELSNSHLLKDNLLTIAKGAYIKMVFRDQGEGIPEKHLNRIFDPYFTSRPDACGMGLSICYSIINRHKGHISVASQLGAGTVATVYLPAQVKTRSTRKEKTSGSRTPDDRAHILVTDDETPVRAITKKILEKSGYRVSLARDGHTAVELYQQAMEDNACFDLVILDHSIPGSISGVQTAKTIIQLDPSARVAVTTGDANALISSDYKNIGLKGVITKPYGFEELTGAVRQLLI